MALLQVLDPEHIDLVREIVALVVQQKRPPLPAAADTQPQQQPNSNSGGGDGVQEALDHATALMATDFFRRRVMRFEERGSMQLKQWTTPLTMLYMRAPSQLCCTVLRGLSDANTLRPLLLECPDQPSRQAMQSLLASAMQRVRIGGFAIRVEGQHWPSIRVPSFLPRRAGGTPTARYVQDRGRVS